MNDLADRVRHERLARNWSVREAATRGKISNTYWGRFEDYRQPLTVAIQEAVATAFDWSPDWPESESAGPVDVTRWVPLERHVELAAAVAALTARVAEMDVAVKQLRRGGGRGSR